jgi:hypothetical protein
MANKTLSSLYKGEYSNSNAYTVGDIVTYLGSSYVCILNTSGNLPTNTNYWGKLAEKGSIGPAGPQGPAGEQGDKGGLRYNFSTDTNDSDPGNGVFKYNSATISNVTQVFIDVLDQAGTDQTTYIDSWDDSTSTIKGYLIIKSNSNSGTTVNVFSILSVTTATGYRKIDVSYVSGSLPSNSEACVIEFIRTGDAGAGNVSGPGSSTNNNIVLFDGTTGKVIKDGGKGIPAGNIVGTTDTQTLTNKRIQKRTSSNTTLTTLTPDISAYDLYQLTAQASALTINNPIGTPVLGETLVILVKASGSDQTITYGTEYKAIGQALITTATNGKWLEIIAEYTESGVWLTSTTIQQ